jgi:hypothetical protein
LFTNSVQAAGAIGGKLPAGLRLSAGNGVALIEVWDGKARPPKPTELEDGIAPLDQSHETPMAGTILARHTGSGLAVQGGRGPSGRGG